MLHFISLHMFLFSDDEDDHHTDEISKDETIRRIKLLSVSQTAFLKVWLSPHHFTLESIKQPTSVIHISLSLSFSLSFFCVCVCVCSGLHW